MWNTKIKNKINNIINTLELRLKKIIENIEKNIHKARQTHVDAIVWYFSIALVATLILIFNMNEYMKYISVKYSIRPYVETSYAYQDNNEIEEIEPLNSALEISDIKITVESEENIIYNQTGSEIKTEINDSDNWKMTSWWWNTDSFNKMEETIKNIINQIPTINNKIEIIPQKSEIIEKINEPVKKSETTKTIVEQKIMINKAIESKKEQDKTTENQVIKVEPKITQTKSIEKQAKIEQKNEPVKIVEQKLEPIKIINESNDTLSISINDDIGNELNKLNNGIFNSFKIKILKNNNLVLENWIWYTYVYTKFHWFWKWVIPSESDLNDWWINKETTVLLLWDNNWAMFATNYKKVKLISNYIISNISNKQAFLNELVDEKKYLQEDTDSLFTQLKTETINITKWANNSQKIQKIYDYILKNINYSKVFDVNNKYIFSWIYTYKNNDGICTGYAKLDLYMLSFAWVDNAKVIKWNVIDAPNFPNIWHAWIQIWSNYYDPTFDDPIWNTSAKTYDEYSYFWLPKDLFYTNRFNYWDLPWELKNADLQTRKNYVINELSKLQSKYSNNNYNLLKSIAVN